MQKTAIKIGPEDHGRPMSLEEFDHAEVQPGFLYELGRGIITVSDVPNPKHLFMVNEVRRQLAAYDLAHPGLIQVVASGGECKILVAGFESERHPDLAVYKSPLPDEENVWATWVPEIVVEVVSSQSRHRDYEERPEEYLQFGVKEYWIIDAEKEKMLARKRVSGQWKDKTIQPSQTYKTSLLLGLEFSCKRVFEAVEATNK